VSASVPNPIFRALNPCFVFRPDTFARACWRKLRPRPERCLIKTAWGDCLEVEPRKFIGAALYMRGVHELSVCEVLWRLAAPGEQAVDVGANIGVMTSLLSKRVGDQGRVFAFEPHPETYRRLEENARRWPRANVLLLDWAVSCRNGRARFFEPEAFHQNDGTASLADASTSRRSFEVRTVRLDDALPLGEYGVLKLDVEGHELEVLEGAARGCGVGQFRDVVFETSWGYPAPAHRFLLGYGYEIFGIEASLRGPGLSEVPRRPAERGRAVDYLATIDPTRARRLVRPRGWKVLRP
jgi:FkbM family methyltransferase